jgi:hypothetical protein
MTLKRFQCSTVIDRHTDAEKLSSSGASLGSLLLAFNIFLAVNICQTKLLISFFLAQHVLVLPVTSILDPETRPTPNLKVLKWRLTEK